MNFSAKYSFIDRNYRYHLKGGFTFAYEGVSMSIYYFSASNLSVNSAKP